MTEQLREDSASTVVAQVRAPDARIPRRAVRDERPPAERILDGAEAMFAQHGYTGSSLRMIAASVNVSHPGLLHHFPSKASLLFGVIDRLEAAAQTALDRCAALDGDPTAVVDHIVDVLDPCSPANQLLAVLDTEAVNCDFPGRFRIARLRRVYEHILARCAESLSRPGGPRRDVSPEFVARALMSLAMGHAVRERSVRALQREAHHDDPRDDLRAIVVLLLTP
ncbi:transcriptional regulator [Brachybacterium phenoliresistens]|uniref:Transcriptional regulator n=1 Tax=Brachybacterium phenoliresistens TaxID=396014 RepID=Z9JRT5_9MICO|nr:TetR/AcrR family transcriptional regulator [Brachybacterium phenoliresistens]EWS80467.1 transcriptional regulator [Brachybacterium phenoliresistens]